MHRVHTQYSAVAVFLHCRCQLGIVYKSIIEFKKFRFLEFIVINAFICFLIVTALNAFPPCGNNKYLFLRLMTSAFLVKVVIPCKSGQSNMIPFQTVIPVYNSGAAAVIIRRILLLKRLSQPDISSFIIPCFR